MPTGMKPADYSVSYESGVLLIKVSGEIDHHSAKPLRESIDRELFYYRAATVILDLSAISFMDSAGLGLILGRYNRVLELDGTLRLLNPTKEIQRLMELADSLTEIKTVCSCGAKATVNARIDAKGYVVTEGDQVMLGGNDCYVAMCHSCWRDAIQRKKQL